RPKEHHLLQLTRGLLIRGLNKQIFVGDQRNGFLSQTRSNMQLQQDNPHRKNTRRLCCKL
ncbi:unnamed protein product, partial [Amoebophrya sp. A25]